MTDWWTKWVDPDKWTEMETERVKKDIERLEKENKEIEEMAKDLDKTCNAFVCGWSEEMPTIEFTRELYNARYRKVGENEIILTQEDLKKYSKDCIIGQETGLDIINGLIARAERKAEEACRKTAKEIYHDIVTEKTPEPIKKEWQKYFKKYGIEVE